MKTFKLFILGFGLSLSSVSFADYPTCQDVINAKINSLHAQINKINANTKAFEELSRQIDYFENKEYLKEQNVYSDRRYNTVSSILTRDRRRKGPDSFSLGSGACFVSDTLVRIKKAYYNYGALTKVDPTSQSTIQNVSDGDYILSSTAHLFPEEPDYQKTCWSQVIGRTVSPLKNHEMLVKLTVSTKGVSTARTFISTPGHMYYIFDKDLKEFPFWERADELSTKEHILFGGIVIGSSNTLVHKNSDLFQAIISADSTDAIESIFGTLVYNLTTDTAAYYVGDFAIHALVHNFSS